MIYDVLTNFNSGNVSYDKDSTDPTVPLEGLSTFVNNKVKIETTKIRDIEKSFSEYQTMQDSVLGLELHNEDQYNRMKESRIRNGISDDFFNIGVDDLANTARTITARNKVKNYINSSEVKSILEEQSKAKDFMSKVDSINSIDPALAVLAKKEYIENYGNRKEKSYSGFDLNIDDFMPLDIDNEMAAIAKDIEREYRMEKDPNSPTGEGYVFINKVSGVTESGRAVFERKVAQLTKNKRFDNNLKSLISLNSKDTDYNDPEARDLFVRTMMEDHLADKVVSTEIKKVDQPKTDSSGNPIPEGSTPTPVKTKTEQVAEILAGRKTEGERFAAELRMNYEANPAYNEYDFTMFDIQARQAKGVPQEPTIDKDGNMTVAFMDDGVIKNVITIPKMKPGQARQKLIQDAPAQSAVNPADVAKQKQELDDAIQKAKSDITINNPTRKAAAESAGVNKGYMGGSTQDGKWVYQGGGSSGKVVIIDQPVNVKDLGLKTKDTPKNNNGKALHLDKSTAMKAKSFQDGLGYDYHITEAGTDTLDTKYDGHKSPKHYDGTAYDMNFKNEADRSNADAIYDAIVKAERNGLRAVFETNDTAIANKVNAKIKAYNLENPNSKIKGNAATGYNITAPHFSIYNDEPISNMVKPGQVKAVDVASDNNNKDYNDFVKANNLKSSSYQDVVSKNAVYLKSNYKGVWDKLAEDEGGEIPSLGVVQEVMSLIAQSEGVAKYLKSKPDDVTNMYKFVKSPQLQEMYMDSLVTSYSNTLSGVDKGKFNENEAYVMMHHEPSKTLGRLSGKVPTMNGAELVKKYGFIENGEYNYDQKKYDNAVRSISDPVEQSLFKLAIADIEGDLDKFAPNVKEMLGFIETDPRAMSSDKRYAAANPNSTAIGKYQIMWSIHNKELNKILKEVDVSDVDVSDVQTGQQSYGTDSIGLNSVLNLNK